MTSYRHSKGRGPQQQLTLFTQRVQELSETRFWQRVALENSSPAAGSEADVQGLNLSIPDVDDEELRSFLLTFRQFIAAQEPTYLDNIFDICHQYLVAEDKRRDFTYLRQVWENVTSGTGLRVQADELDLTPLRILWLYINGHYFNSSPRERQELKQLEASFRHIDKVQFLIAVYSLSNLIIIVGNNVSYGLQNNLYDFQSRSQSNATRIN